MKITALTPREAEIARFVAVGLSNRQIAQKARISESAVKNLLHRAFRKLGIANRVTLAVPIVERPAASRENAITKLLTRREAEIARFVAVGLSNRQIAQKASISEGTVKLHLCNAYKKLGIANRSTLAAMVARTRTRKSREVHVASHRA